MTALPFSAFEVADFSITTKGDVQRLQGQQDRSKARAWSFRTARNQRYTPIRACEDFQNQTGLAPVVAVQHVGRLIGNSFGNHFGCAYLPNSRARCGVTRCLQGCGHTQWASVERNSFKQGPWIWLCQAAGAAAHSGGSGHTQWASVGVICSGAASPSGGSGHTYWASVGATSLIAECFDTRLIVCPARTDFDPNLKKHLIAR